MDNQHPHCLSCGAEIEPLRTLCDRCVETKVNPAALRLMQDFERAFEVVKKHG